MSLPTSVLLAAEGLKRAGLGAIGGAVTSAIGGLFGGGGSDDNLARNFSKRQGLSCVIRDSDKAKALQLIEFGVDPCTGQSTRPAVTVPTDFGTVQGPPDIPSALPGGAPIVGALNTMSLPATISRIGGSLVGGVIRTATGKISSVVAPSGRKFSRKQAVALLKRAGDIATGAALMGISSQDAAEMILQTPPRRRRGITAAQVANARRTTRMVKKLATDLGCCRTTPVRRKSPCR
jgi:hypothetical protein